MGDVARPMLAEVLAALTDTEADTWSFDRRSVVRVGADGARWTPAGVGWASDTAPWTITDPAEAQEALVARGLLPEGWCGDVRRGWVEEIRNTFPGALFERLVVERSAPRTLPDLVAVASLGVPAIQQAEELAREVCVALREGGYVEPQRTVWRVGKPDHATVALVPYGINRDAARACSCGDVTRGDGGTVVDRVEAIAALWEMGLALDAIDRDAVRIVVPPVGGSRG